MFSIHWFSDRTRIEAVGALAATIGSTTTLVWLRCLCFLGAAALSPPRRCLPRQPQDCFVARRCNHRRRYFLMRLGPKAGPAFRPGASRNRPVRNWTGSQQKGLDACRPQAPAPENQSLSAVCRHSLGMGQVIVVDEGRRGDLQWRQRVPRFHHGNVR